MEKLYISTCGLSPFTTISEVLRLFDDLHGKFYIEYANDILTINFSLELAKQVRWRYNLFTTRSIHSDM
jgi:hypothetical protein